jgi:hypothetical protein
MMPAASIVAPFEQAVAPLTGKFRVWGHCRHRYGSYLTIERSFGSKEREFGAIASTSTSVDNHDGRLPSASIAAPSNRRSFEQGIRHVGTLWPQMPFLLISLSQEIFPVEGAEAGSSSLPLVLSSVPSSSSALSKLPSYTPCVP